jgi:hypothetical protein
VVVRKKATFQYSITVENKACKSNFHVDENKTNPSSRPEKRESRPPHQLPVRAVDKSHSFFIKKHNKITHENSPENQCKRV